MILGEPGFQTYQGDDGMWHWLLMAGNHRVVARGEGSFTTKGGARRAVLDIITDIRADRIAIEDAA